MACDGCPEYLDTEHISQDFFSFLIKVWVDKSVVVIDCNAVPKRGELLLDSLHLHGLRKAVDQVLEFLVTGCIRDEKTSLVAWSENEIPAVSRPMMRVPAMVALITLIEWPSSASNTE